jgi:hypothetical protein
MHQQLAIVDALKTKKWGIHPIPQKLTIFDAGINSVDMNPKKPTSRKSKSAGISLEPDLIKRSKEFAEKNGFGSLSNWVRFLLTQELSRAAGNPSYKLEEVGKPTAKNNGSEKGKVQSGVGVVIEPGSETSAFGHLTPTKKNSRKAG